MSFIIVNQFCKSKNYFVLKKVWKERKTITALKQLDILQKNAFGIKGSLIPKSSLTFLIKGPNPIRENTFWD